MAYESVHSDIGWEQQWAVDRRHIRDAIGSAARNHEKELFLYSEGLLHVPVGMCHLTHIEVCVVTRAVRRAIE